MTLYEQYKQDVVSSLSTEFGLKNVMSVPKLKKVVVNVGIGTAKENKEEQETILNEIAKITGQKSSLRRASKAIAGFSIRRGQPVGIKVTLRGKRMYDFLEKFFKIVLPRIRDFRGLSRNGFDISGNYTLGISEITVFPEIDLGKINKVHGLEITIVTNTRDKEKSMRLLEKLGMPFEKGKTVKVNSKQ